MTKTAKVLNALMAGQQLTAKQIASRYSAGNPYDIVHNLREQGYNISLTTHADSKGRVTNKYSLA